MRLECIHWVLILKQILSIEIYAILTLVTFLYILWWLTFLSPSIKPLLQEFFGVQILIIICLFFCGGQGEFIREAEIKKILSSVDLVIILISLYPAL